MQEENTTNESKLYELGYHLVSSISEDQVSAEVEKIHKILKDNNVEIIKEGQAKSIKLAYQMIKHVAGKNQKFSTVYFGWIKFNSTADDIEKIKEEIDLNENILRSLIIKTVDDDEHSTAKILDEEAKKAEEEKENEEKAEEETEPSEPSEPSEKVEE